MAIFLLLKDWEKDAKELEKEQKKEAERYYDFYDEPYSHEGAERALFHKKWETMKTPYDVRANLKHFFVIYLIGVMLAYGVACGIRALNPNLPKNDKLAKTEKIMTPYAKTAVPLNLVWLAFWGGAFLRNHKKRENYFAKSEYYDLHMLERLCHESGLTIDQICAGDAKYVFDLAKLDRRYIDGLLNGNFESGQLSYEDERNIKGLIIAHLRQYPDDYEKIVSALVGKHKIFTPEFFERLKGYSTNKSMEEYLVKRGAIKNIKSK